MTVRSSDVSWKVGVHCTLVAGAACCLSGLSGTILAEPHAPAATIASAVEASEFAADGTPAKPSGYWAGDWAFGDWGGARSALQGKGFDATIRLTQGYQGVARGSSVDRGAYGGKFLTDFSFDLEKLVDRRGLSIQLLTETRFGSIPDIIGAKMSTITYLLTPTASGTEFAITALNFTQLVPLDGEGSALAIGAGRYMGFDGANSPLNGGGGHTNFMHMVFNGTPTNGLLVPSVTNGAKTGWIREGNRSSHSPRGCRRSSDHVRPVGLFPAWRDLHCRHQLSHRISW
jgi:hypothetical protein